MISKNNILIIALLSLVVSTLSLAQDPIFSQISPTDSYLNPANSFNSLLTNTKANIELQFRDQWAAVSKGSVYNTIKAQGDYNVYKNDYDSWNVGMILLRDQSNNNALRQTNLRFLAAYSRKLSGRSFRNDGSHFITVGTSFGLAQSNANINNLWFGRQFDVQLLTIDPSLSNGELLNTDAISYNDINLGVKWTYVLEEEKIFSAGLGIDHINNPVFSYVNDSKKLSPRYNFQAAVELTNDESFSHRPKLSVIYHAPFYQIVPSYQFAVGIENLDNNITISLGLSGRIVNAFNGLNLDAYIFEIGLLAENWNFGFSFDLTASDLSNFVNSNGAIELSLGYKIIEE